MPKARQRYEIDGTGWLIVGYAARLLGTSAAGVRKLMGDGTLDWRQVRPNSKILVVDERRVFDLRHQRQRWKKEGAFKIEPRRRSAGTSRRLGILDRTWDPSPGPREKKD